MNFSYEDSPPFAGRIDAMDTSSTLPTGLRKDEMGRFVDPNTPENTTTPRDPCGTAGRAVDMIADLFRNQKEAVQRNIDRINASIQSAELDFLRHQTTLQTLELGV